MRGKKRNSPIFCAHQQHLKRRRHSAFVNNMKLATNFPICDWR